jgi:hypothetical protein
MRKMLKFAVLGGVVGAGVAIAKSTSGAPEPAAEEEAQAMKTVGGGAIAGAAIGLLLDRRSKKRAKQVATGAKVAATVAGMARSAKPKLEHAIEFSRPHLEHAAEATRDAALSATEAARARLAKAA